MVARRPRFPRGHAYRLEVGPDVMFECPACRRVLVTAAPTAPRCASGHREARMRRAWPGHGR